MKWLKWTGIVLVIVLAVAVVALFEGDLPRDVVDAKYTNPASRFLEAGGARIHYRDEGNPDGLPVVLIHGANASLHTWEPWVARLGEQYRLITLDLPAHGLTGAVPHGDYSAAGQVRTVRDVVQHLGIEQFVLGGNSMGGGVTWRYALQYPDEVQAMILVDSVGLPQWRQRPAADGEEESGETPLVFSLLGKPWFRALARYIDPWYLAAQGARAAYNNSPVVTDELITRYYELALREGTRDAILGRFENMGRRNTEPVDPARLPQPTLVMWGREDALILADVGERFGAELPNAELVIFDGIGHVPMEEIPESSAAAVRTFLVDLEL